MKAGVNLINFGPGASPESLARTAALAEALGYHFVMTSDHVAVTPDVAASVVVDVRQVGELPPGGRARAAIGPQRSLLATLPEVTFFSRYTRTFAP